MFDRLEEYHFVSFKNSGEDQADSEIEYQKFACGDKKAIFVVGFRGVFAYSKEKLFYIKKTAGEFLENFY